MPAVIPFTRVMVGDQIRIMNGSQSVLRRVLAIRVYPSLYKAIETENLSRVCHGDAAQTAGYLERVYHPESFEIEALAIEITPT